MDKVTGGRYVVVPESLRQIDLGLENPDNQDASLWRIDLKWNRGPSMAAQTMECLAFGRFVDDSFELCELRRVLNARMPADSNVAPFVVEEDSVIAYVVATAIGTQCKSSNEPEDKPAS